MPLARLYGHLSLHRSLTRLKHGCTEGGITNLTYLGVYKVITI